MLELQNIFQHLSWLVDLDKGFIFDLKILKNLEIENEFMSFLLQSELSHDMKLEV